MTTKKRVAFVILALLIVLIGASGWSLYASIQQNQKNAELIAAIKRFDVKTVETLLKSGADANARDVTDRRTLWQRIGDLFFHRTPPVVKGPPALALAIMSWPDDIQELQQTEELQRGLIQHGADPNVKNRDGMTSLTWGCASGDMPLVALALAHGARVNDQDEFGATPLMHAVLTGTTIVGSTDLVATLLAHGDDVNAKDNDGRTALIYALAQWAEYPGPLAPAVVKMLLEHGADVNVKNANGDTPLKLAIKAKRPDLIRLLKQHGAKQ